MTYRYSVLLDVEAGKKLSKADFKNLLQRESVYIAREPKTGKLLDAVRLVSTIVLITAEPHGSRDAPSGAQSRPRTGSRVRPRAPAEDRPGAAEIAPGGA